MRDADIIRKHKNLVYVQALKLLQTAGRPKAPKRQRPRRQAGARRAAAAAQAALGEQELMQAGRAQRSRAGPVKESRRQCQAPTTRSREKYLERAIRELNQLTHELQDCPHCPRGKLMPVLGSGHPQADVFMLKHAPGVAEIEEGVAFYGRAGNALMKSFKRLGIDPLVVYGTLCVKCPIAEPDLAAEECVARLVEEMAIVQPKIVVVMGEPALRVLNGLQVPLSRPIEAREGEIQAFTPTIDALYMPDIDDSLDEEGAKRAGHRRLPRRGGRQAALLARLQDARRLVRGPAAVLTGVGSAPRSDGRPPGGSWRSVGGLRGLWTRRIATPGGGEVGCAAPTVRLRIRRVGTGAVRGAGRAS